MPDQLTSSFSVPRDVSQVSRSAPKPQGRFKPLPRDCGKVNGQLLQKVLIGSDATDLVLLAVGK